MKKETFFEVLGDLDEDLVLEAGSAGSAAAPTPRRGWVKWCAAAACLALAVAAAAPLLRATQDKLPTQIGQVILFDGAMYEVCQDRQILGRLGIDRDITRADAGEAVAYLKKRTPDARAQYVEAEGPTDIVLYAYDQAPCGAVYVIGDRGRYDAAVFCNFLLSDDDAAPLERLYQLYGVERASDIASLSLVDDSFEKNVVGPRVADSGAVARFYRATLALRGYDQSTYHDLNYGQRHFQTEEELLEAYKQTESHRLTLMVETAAGLRFCLKYDPIDAWLSSDQTLSYYKATQDLSDWFTEFMEK